LRWFHPQLEAYLGCTVLREYGGPACGCNLHTPIRIMYYCGSLRPALTAFMQCELAPQARSLREEPWIGEVSQFEHVVVDATAFSNQSSSFHGSLEGENRR